MLTKVIESFLLVLVASQITMAQSDTQPPQLLDMSFTPSSVDVTLSAQTLTFSLHLTDNLSGISGATVALRSPSGLQTPAGGFGPSGVVLDNTFDVPVQIQRYSEPGTWTVAFVVVNDRVGNSAFLNTGALAAAGFPTTFAVTDARYRGAGDQ